MKILRHIVNLLPNAVAFYERICIRIATEGFHKPGYYASTLFFAPLGMALWRKPIPAWWKRITARLLAYFLLILAVMFFFRGPGVLALLILPGRLVRRLWRKIGFDESREFPYVPRRLGFAFTRTDRAVMVFLGVMLLVFFTNRSQLMPREDSDHNYHMAVARQILERGHVPKWDDWEYAPAGRPHLYPPALHLLIAMFSGNRNRVAEGFETLQVVVYPLSILLAWWFARWLFGPRLGLMAAIVFSMDMAAGFTMVAVLPSALVTALMPLLFMTFLTRRGKATIALLTFAFYTHMGMAPLIVIGLFVFSVRHRGYYAFFKHVLAWSFGFYVPWFLQVLSGFDWLGTISRHAFGQGGGLRSVLSALIVGIFSLQLVNPVFLVLGMVGLKRFRDPASGFLRHCLAGFLPMLVFYGGRFWMHTSPIWSVFIASLLARFVPDQPRPRRLIALMLCTLIPLPLIAVGFRGAGRIRLMPNVGGAVFSLGYALSPASDDTDFNKLADFIRAETWDREIVHVDPAKNYLGDRIVAETGRRVDVGGWAAEVRNARMAEIVSEYRKNDTNCLFVYENAGVPPELNCDRTEKIGRFNVGIRGKQVPLDAQTHPPEPEVAAHKDKR